MKSHSELRFLELFENVRHHFDFLFRRGFHIASLVFVDQNYEDWQITMAREDCIIKLYSYMGNVSLALSIPQLFRVVGLLELGDLIYGIHEDGELSALQEPSMNEAQELRRTAQLLERYIDKILANIGKMLVLLSFEDPPVQPSKLAAMFPYN